MDSSSLSDFSTWHPFNRENVKQCPKIYGLYVIRNESGLFGRLKGKSDIIYVGSTTAKNGLRQRLSQYFNPGESQYTNKRILELSCRYSLEFAWIEVKKPREYERQLLARYLSDHDELPPINRAGLRTLRDVVNLSSSFNIRKTNSA